MAREMKDIHENNLERLLRVNNPHCVQKISENPKEVVTHCMSSSNIWDNRETKLRATHPKKSSLAPNKHPQALS